VVLTPEVDTLSVVHGPDPVAPPSRGPNEEFGLLDSLEWLRNALAGLRFPLELPGVAEARTLREQLQQQLDDHVLPRFRRNDSPLLTVVGGSTGAGKSTLVNSLVRREVSRSGVLRPTTRSPVLVHNPSDAGAFMSQRVLPGLTRLTAEGPEPFQPRDVEEQRVTALRLVPDAGLASGLALIDAPDIDSVVQVNRDLADQLLAAADLWLFVTTAERYADALPWERLREAAGRGVAVGIVLDRVPPEDMQEIRVHLALRLRDRGLAGAPMFTIAESELEGGFLPADAVAPLLRWTTLVARDRAARTAIANRTLAGAIDTLPGRAESLVEAAQAQADAERGLLGELDVVAARLRTETAMHLSDGSLLRGELLARWEEFVAAGDFLRSMETRTARLKGLLGSRGPVELPTESLDEAVRGGIEAMVRSQARAAAEETATLWQAQPAGAGVVRDRPELSRPAPDFDRRLDATVLAWQEFVVELAREQSRARRQTAKTTSLGVDGLAVVLQLLSFTPTADPFQPKVTPAGSGPGTAVGRRLLDAVFSPRAVNTMIQTARHDLLERTGALLEEERLRLHRLLDDVHVTPDQAGTLAAATQAVQDVRAGRKPGRR
jgi:hypothetical protein